MEKAGRDRTEIVPPGVLRPPARDPLMIRRRGRRRELFRFKTLVQAERVLERLSNLMADREECDMDRRGIQDRRAEIAQQRLECQALGRPPEEWPKFPEMPPLRGISTALGAKVVSAINAFIISRRFSDEFVAGTAMQDPNCSSRAIRGRAERICR